MATKISQEQLRKFMKEKRESSKSQKVESPFAKYSSSGQLSCSICNIVIKANNLWASHIVGKIHKENLLKSKKKNDTSTKNNLVPTSKRSNEDLDSNATKKQKTEEFKVPLKPLSTKQNPSTSLLASYSSSDDDSNEEEEVPKLNVVSNSNSSLPSDFFDNSSSNEVASDSLLKPQVKQDSAATISKKAETLPEGFFDDPILDAKARNIEYKDPIEEEWERFQKSIAEESNVSKTIIEEDLEESIIERGINQIDEQIHQWGKKVDLESLADDVKRKAKLKEDLDLDSTSTDEDLDEDDLLDWRSKSIKKF